MIRRHRLAQPARSSVSLSTSIGGSSTCPHSSSSAPTSTVGCVDVVGAPSTFDEALVPEDVVEVPVAVDDPPHRPAEGGQVVQELVGLAEIAPRVDDEQGLGAAHHADVEVVAVVPPSKATVADLVPH